MREVFQRIFSEYLIEKEKPAKGNALYGYLIRSECDTSFYSTNIIDKTKYMVKSSGGQGGWGYIPWIGVFDKEIGITAEKGFYIVYLFSADMKRVYLSLNQGWTFYKKTYGARKGKENIRKVSAMWKSILLSGLDEFSFDRIDLAYRGKTTNLPKGYEMGHICGKYYEASNLPDEETMLRDLQNLLTVFRELKGKMIDNSVERTINHLVSEYASGGLEDIKEKKDERAKLIDAIIANEGMNSSLNVKGEMPDFVSEIQKIKGKKNKTVSKVDYTNKAKRQEKLGLAGELMVLEHEKKKLANMHIKKNVEHISQTIGDSAGYDIKSYDENGDEIHIEVKTTKNDINTPFYLTQNELFHCRDNADIYRLYRIYNFNEKTNAGDMYIIEGDITSEIDLEPCTYISKGRKLR